ncbi:hypothetical protein EV2_009648 [Malus domestica]
MMLPEESRNPSSPSGKPGCFLETMRSTGIYELVGSTGTEAGMMLAILQKQRIHLNSTEFWEFWKLG